MRKTAVLARGAVRRRSDRRATKDISQEQTRNRKEFARRAKRHVTISRLRTTCCMPIRFWWGRVIGRKSAVWRTFVVRKSFIRRHSHSPLGAPARPRGRVRTAAKGPTGAPECPTQSRPLPPSERDRNNG